MYTYMYIPRGDKDACRMRIHTRSVVCTSTKGGTHIRELFDKLYLIPQSDKLKFFRYELDFDG